MKSLRKYLITIAAGLLGAFAIAYSKDIFSVTDPATLYHILCDSFFVMGVVLTGFGLLIFSTNEGTFDMLVYGVSSFVDIFRRTSRKKYDTFYDYRAAHQEKKVKFGFMLICGLAFLAVAGVMYLLYSKNI